MVTEELKIRQNRLEKLFCALRYINCNMANQIKNNSKNNNVVLTRSKRFEQSPYLSCYDRSGIVSGVYAGRFFPLYYGDDPAAKYWVLRRKAHYMTSRGNPLRFPALMLLPFWRRFSLARFLR